MKFSTWPIAAAALALSGAALFWGEQALAQDAAPAATDQATLVRAAKPPAKPILAWAAKPAKLPPYVAPNRLVYRLADILAKHKGKDSWSPQVFSQPRRYRRMDLDGTGRKDQDPVLCRRACLLGCRIRFDESNDRRPGA